MTVKFSNGQTLTGTPNHPVWVDGRAYTALRGIRYGDKIQVVENYLENASWQTPIQTSEQKPLHTKALSLTDTLIRQIGLIVNITGPIQDILKRGYRRFIERFGKTITTRYLKVITSTIRTAIPATMLLETLNVYRQKNMPSDIHSPKRDARGQETTWQNTRTLPPFGIGLKRGAHGIAKWASNHGKVVTTIWHNAIIAARHLRRRFQAGLSFVQTNASPHLGGRWVLTTNSGHVNIAASRIRSTNTANDNIVQNNAPALVAFKNELNRVPVYNLTVDNTVGDGEYFANGILVHNCDALRYMAEYLRKRGRQ